MLPPCSPAPPRSLMLLSIAALALILFLWLTSYFHYRLFSDHGRVLVLIVKANDGAGHWLRVNPPGVGTWEDHRLPSKTLRFAGHEFASFKNSRYTYTYFSGAGKSESFFALHCWLLAIPYWSLALIAAILPALYLLAIARHRTRLRQGRCLACGYDLRETSQGERCPECGTPKPAS